jgi:hypothetical protein
MCGMTRASISLITFRFADAFMYHPLVYIMPILFIVVFFKGLFPMNKLYYSKVFWICIFVLFFIVYVYRMITLFPDTVPMNVHNDSYIRLFLQ